MEALRTLVGAAGGCPPLVPRRSARWLALAEREEISRGIVAGHSGRLIGGRIRCAGSTVSIRDRQERGAPPLPRVPGGGASPEPGPPSQSCETRRLSAVAAGGAVVDLGPGQRDGAARAVHDRYRPADLHLRSTQPVAARHEREHERPPPPVLPKGHQPRRGQPGRTRRRRRRTERPPSTNPRLVVTL